MTNDRRRRLRLAGQAAARELLAWLAEVANLEASPELLEVGAARGSAALRAVLGAAREPTAAGWGLELEIAGGVVRAHPVAPAVAELPDVEWAAMATEIETGFRDEAAPAFTRALAARSQR